MKAKSRTIAGAFRMSTVILVGVDLYARFSVEIVQTLWQSKIQFNDDLDSPFGTDTNNGV